MAQEDEAGVSYRETLEGLLKRARTAERRAELEAELELPEFPAALRYLWEMFFRLRRRQGGNGFAPAPLSWPAIDAFLRLSGCRVTPWEVELIEGLDDLWLEQRSTKNGQTTLSR